MLEAVQRGHFPTITLEDCKTACMIAESFAAEIRRLGSESLGKGKFESLKIRVLTAIKRHPGIDRRRLLRNMSGISGKVFKDVESTILETGEAILRDGGFYLGEEDGK
jgi:hypothetical protein